MGDKIKKSPNIRFAGFTDAWEQRKLGDVVVRVTRKNKDLESTLPLTISAQDGLIDQNEFFNKTVASRDVSGYYLVKNGEFAYNKSYSNGYPWGAVKRLDRYEMGVLSTLYIVFKPTDIDSDFLSKYYDGHNWHKEVSKHAAEGARNHGLLNIAASDFFETELTIPLSKSEQKQIGVLFKNLDNLITLHQRKLELLKVTKKSMLQKMFPKDGESVPEIRFAGFTDAWEQRKLGEIVTIKSGGAPSAFEPGNELYIKVDDLNYSFREQINSQMKVDVNSRYSKVKKGSTIFPKRGAAIMTNKVRIMGISGYMDTNMMALEPEDISSEFLYLFISKTGLYKIADTSTIPQINNKHIEPYEIIMPKIEEQEKLGSMFLKIDNLITLHQRELDSLKNLKKSMLQQMFI